MTWSIILLKNSYLFKIAELEIFFIQKLIIDSIILNKLEFFSEIVDKWRGLLEDYIISPILGIKKFHISTSTSAIILKIQIKNIFFFFYLLSLSWQPNSTTNTKKKCHFKHCTVNPLSLKTMNAVFPLAQVLCTRPCTSTYWSFIGSASLSISVQTLVPGVTFDWRSKIGTSW